MGRGRTAYVFRTGQPLLLTPELLAELGTRGEVKSPGTAPAAWLGVPLKTATETIGVLIVQNYEDTAAYSERDLEFLSSVGGQIALASERQWVDEALRASEDRYQDLVENSQELIVPLGEG